MATSLSLSGFQESREFASIWLEGMQGEKRMLGKQARTQQVLVYCAVTGFWRLAA
jgi:hypothetical protein